MSTINTTPNKLDTASAVAIATLITFTWGASGQVRRYAIWTKDLVLSGITFTALPLCEIDYGDQHGGSEDVPVKMNINSKIEPIASMIGQRFYPTQVIIEELDPTDPATRRTTFRGRIATVTGNYQGRGGVARVQINGLRDGLDIPLGIMATNDCQLTFGSKVCGKDLGPLRKNATIAQISGNHVTIGTPNAGVLGQADRYWHVGSMAYDGYEIKIRDWVSGATFTLVRQPPSDWLGKTVTLTPGCLKTPAACIVWGRIRSFLGIGIGMPAKHPQIDINE